MLDENEPNLLKSFLREGYIYGGERMTYWHQCISCLRNNRYIKRFCDEKYETIVQF